MNGTIQQQVNILVCVYTRDILLVHLSAYTSRVPLLCIPSVMILTYTHNGFATHTMVNVITANLTCLLKQPYKISYMYVANWYRYRPGFFRSMHLLCYRAIVLRMCPNPIIVH